MLQKKAIATFLTKWPIVIVALGMALTLIWMATLVWFFMTATGYAASSLAG